MSERYNNLEGGAALDALLKTLAPNIEKNIMRAALAAGGRVLRDEAKRLAPVGRPSNVAKEKYGGYPGALRDSIRVSTRVGKDGKVSASVKAGGRTNKRSTSVFYAHIVEFGARAHAIKAKKARALQIGESFAAGEVQHPGVRPRPFMRPAADQKFSEAMAAVTEQVRKRLTARGLTTPAPVPAEE